MKVQTKVRSLVITGFGLNCEEETAQAFTMADAEAERVHFNDLLHDKRPLDRAHILCLIGGFSFGDHLGAGTVFANKIRTRLGEALAAFVERGGLVLGICNGFQTLAKLGLLPGFGDERFARKVTLAANDTGVFRDAWVHLRADPQSPCVFTRGIQRIELPVRHGEGKFVPADPDVLRALKAGSQVALVYADPETGEPTETYPDNPNGSVAGVAGICDPTGRIFGLMPHPEAYLWPWNHPRWTRSRIEGSLPDEGAGLCIFRNAVSFASGSML